MTDHGGLTPEERAAFAAMDEQLDAEMAALKRLEEVDPVGLAMFGDDDGWLDSRL